ncbi:MAG: M48 family metallopeptidase [Ornithinimicrobium sp.]
MLERVPDRVEIRRSARRRRTVSARIEGDRVVVLMPQGLSSGQEQTHVDEVLAGLRRRIHRRLLADDDLLPRATRLAQTHFPDRGQVADRTRSVRWVSNQHLRWGSCTPAEGTIRISDRLRGAPLWVLDAVLVHELAHLIEPGHGADFAALTARYPRYEQAQAFLAGVSWASGGATSGNIGGDEVGRGEGYP